MQRDSASNNYTDFLSMVTLSDLIIKSLTFVIFQLMFLTLTIFLAFQVPTIGSLVKYLVGNVAALEQVTQIAELQSELAEHKHRLKHTENLNTKLASSLIQIETEHPHLFDENHEPKPRTNMWAYALGATGACIVLLLFFYGKRFNADGLVDSGIALAQESERMNAIRHDAISNRLDVITNHLITQDNYHHNALRESNIARTGVNAILNTVSGLIHDAFQTPSSGGSMSSASNIDTITSSNAGTTPESIIPTLTYSNIPEEILSGTPAPFSSNCSDSVDLR